MCEQIIVDSYLGNVIFVENYRGKIIKKLNFDLFSDEFADVNLIKILSLIAPGFVMSHRT